MNVSLILAHPDQGSFNHAISDSCRHTLVTLGHRVFFHDLYREDFDPILPKAEIPKNGVVSEDVKTHCDEISSADGIIIVHPNWWGQPPAILKGWVDRVLRPGVAYAFLEDDLGDGVPYGLLKAATAVVFNTANTTSDREQTVFGDPLQLLWRNCIFDLCGVPTFHREMFTVVVTSTLEERRAWLRRVEQIIVKYFPRSLNGQKI